jgi:hypothetical protein
MVLCCALAFSLPTIVSGCQEKVETDRKKTDPQDAPSERAKKLLKDKAQ